MHYLYSVNILTLPQLTQLDTYAMAEGFDQYLGKRWIYPNNMAVRGYQKAAVEKALFNNAMIVLPTGFGKTFIAAVVMYNFYRWYPQGKLIFVAPTRPLVAQQITECKKISGIPPSDCIELTGSTAKEKRISLWKTKRVFFATPQVIENDLSSEIVPATQVRCLVLDEAHKAQGSYAYVGIVRQLHDKNRNGFRILALSATPGSDIQRVQQVMINLYISEVMFRTETSIDLMPFKNDKICKAWTVELTGKHREFVNRFIAMTKPIFTELYRSGLIYSKDSIEMVATGLLVMAMKKVQSNECSTNGMTKGRLGYLIGVATALCYKFELLTIYGIRPFYSSIVRDLSEPRSCIRNVLNKNPDFNQMLSDIRLQFGTDVEPDMDKVAQVDLLQSHPKLKVVKELLLNHFKENDEKTQTRAMVFSKFRESVYDIAQTLKAYEPILKVGAFTGQAKSVQHNSGMKQKEQIQMVKDFREGKYNVLVATCVAEEGLDIGEIDLIICYDTTSSPISNTQRRGRTGRKRAGDVQTLLTKDFEEKRLKKAGFSRRQVEEQLYKRDNYMSFRYRDAPRMVPPDINPICLEQKIYPVEEEEVEEPKRKKIRLNATPKNKANTTKKGKESSVKKILAKKEDEEEEPLWSDSSDDFICQSTVKIKNGKKSDSQEKIDANKQENNEAEWSDDSNDVTCVSSINIKTEENKTMQDETAGSDADSIIWEDF